MTPRTEAQILAGELPGVEPLELGGQQYAVREPSLLQTQKIMGLQVEYQSLISQAESLSPHEQLVAVNLIMVQMLRAFSKEIDQDWPRIEAEATAEEVLRAVEVVSRVVAAPFMRRAQAASALPNREARRQKRR